MEKTSPKKLVPIPEFTLIVCSILVTLVMLEVTYRFYLGFEQKASNKENSLNYWAFNDAITKYDYEFGYSYVADSHFTMVRISAGYPVMCNKVSVNKSGNTNRIKGNYEEADLKILVFGDSFTANIHHDGLAWPDLLQDKLEERFLKKVNVMSFGRSGYGVLQMFDLAHAEIDEFNPDLVIIAFITDDLDRGRFWRTVDYVNGEKRVFTSINPSEKSDLATAANTAVLNPLVTEEWCESMLVSHQEDDLLLKELNNQFVRLRNENIGSVDFSSISTSFLLNKIVHGNPFYDFVRPSVIPHITFDSFEQDERFVENVVALNQSNTPYYVVHLPTYQELKTKRYILGDQQGALLQSLQGITNRSLT